MPIDMAIRSAVEAASTWQGAWSLGRLRRAAGAPLALAIEDDAMERVAAAFEGQVRTSEDLVAQGLHVARAARAEIEIQGRRSA